MQIVLMALWSLCYSSWRCPRIISFLEGRKAEHKARTILLYSSQEQNLCKCADLLLRARCHCFRQMLNFLWYEHSDMSWSKIISILTTFLWLPWQLVIVRDLYKRTAQIFSKCRMSGGCFTWTSYSQYKTDTLHRAAGYIANCLGTGNEHLHPSSATFPSLGHWVRLGGLLQRARICSARAFGWPRTSCRPKAV